MTKKRKVAKRRPRRDGYGEAPTIAGMRSITDREDAPCSDCGNRTTFVRVTTLKAVESHPR